MKPKPPEEGTVPVEIEDLDGIGQFGLVLRWGMTELLGPNGGHKTRVQKAISDTASRRREVEVGVTDAKRDGNDALLGSATVAGRTLRVSRSGSVQREGKLLAALEIVDPGPVSRLIDPGLIDEEAQRKAQLRAFLELVPLKITEPYLEAITGGDTEVLGWLRPDLAERGTTDLLGATKRMRSVVQAEARRKESEVEGADRRVSGQDQVLDEISDETVSSLAVLCEGTPNKEWAARTLLQNWPRISELEGERRAADRVAAGAKVKLEAYRADVAKQDELRATTGERPDDADLRVAVDEAVGQIANADRECEYAATKVVHLKGILDRAQDAVNRAKADVAEGEAAEQLAQEGKKTAEAGERWAKRALAERLTAQSAWDDTNAFLQTKLEGPAPAEVVGLEAAAERKTMEIEAARLSVRYKKAIEIRKEAQSDKATAETRSTELREIERLAWNRLGELVTRKSRVPEITIAQGWLAYVVPGSGEIHDWNSKYVSSGMRNGAAFRLGARCFGEGSILMIDGGVYERLDLDARIALHQVCFEERIFGLTEVASFRSDELKYVAVGSEAWTDQFFQMAVAAAMLTRPHDEGARIDLEEELRDGEE